MALPTLHIPAQEPLSMTKEYKNLLFCRFNAYFLHLKVMEIILKNLHTALGKNPHWIYTYEALGEI